MLKRGTALLLWFYAGWTLGALAAYLTGCSEAAGPVLGAAAAALFAGDPRRIIWTRRTQPAGVASQGLQNPA
jgi:hypothetical protein